MITTAFVVIIAYATIQGFHDFKAANLVTCGFFIMPVFAAAMYFGKFQDMISIDRKVIVFFAEHIKQIDADPENPGPIFSSGE